MGQGCHRIVQDFLYKHDATVSRRMIGSCASAAVGGRNRANDLTSVSFSSIRSGTLEERDQWMSIQEWFIEDFFSGVTESWLIIPEGNAKTTLLNVTIADNAAAQGGGIFSNVNTNQFDVATVQSTATGTVQTGTTTFSIVGVDALGYINWGTDREADGYGIRAMVPARVPGGMSTIK